MASFLVIFLYGYLLPLYLRVFFLRRPPVWAGKFFKCSSKPIRAKFISDVPCANVRGSSKRHGLGVLLRSRVSFSLDIPRLVKSFVEIVRGTGTLIVETGRNSTLGSNGFLSADVATSYFADFFFFLFKQEQHPPAPLFLRVFFLRPPSDFPQVSLASLACEKLSNKSFEFVYLYIFFSLGLGFAIGSLTNIIKSPSLYSFSESQGFDILYLFSVVL